MIWFKNYTLDDLRHARSTDDTVMGYIGLEFTDLSADSLSARMQVGPRVHQVYGILHGGVTCFIAETIGSIASTLVIDPEKLYSVGSIITINHLRPVTEGYVNVTCRPIHLGRTKHVWDIVFTNDAGKITAKSELTCSVQPRRGQE